MSHEVRTPLNSIVGFSQVLASEFRDKPATGEYASIIEANSATLLRLFDDVLEVAYLDQTGDLPRCDVTALNNLCNDCVESTLPELHPGVSLLDELPVSDPVVRTNLKRIEQVLLHLLRNAAKFTRSGRIVLTYECLPAERLFHANRVVNIAARIAAGFRFHLECVGDLRNRAFDYQAGLCNQFVL